ncbi:MAG TPA: TrmH family RNA methyltransferase [Planctomycetaceae bacterium]|nr:TrmH family RNA methyltransferase [Planctomycetaceae bacterium]
MPGFIHQRHKEPVRLERPRELVLVCAPLRSNVNFSRIVRAAGCSGVRTIIAAGRPRLDRDVARAAADEVQIETRRTLPPVLRTLKAGGYRLVGLEQTTNSQNLTAYRFERRTALVIGNERQGLSGDVLDLLDDVVEIPVFGLPYSHNAATAAAIALYEYCRQYPGG